MKKLLVSDYDGTFYVDDESIKHNIHKVKEFRNKGNIFAIATGRSFYDFIEKLKQFDIEYDYLIINHGASLLNKNHNLIKNYYIDNKVKQDIKNEFNLVDGKNIFTCKCLESRVSINEKNITKIHIEFKTKEKLIKIKDILNTKYKHLVNSYLITGLNNCIEVTSLNSEKSIAIKEIAQIEDIKQNNIFTIGDSFNDLKMLETFNGFCMQKSEELIKQKITRKCTSVEEIIDIVIGDNNE